MTWARSRTLLSRLRLDRSVALSSQRQCWGLGFRRWLGSKPHPLTEVEKILLDTIKSTGPISFATYMQMCLSHPEAGYYMNAANQVIGSKGDFITSPEISQVFGELLAVWLLSQWMTSGSSRRIRLVELGPGRGTLMHDVLRVFSQFPASRKAVKEICLVETSEAMRSTQKAKLGDYAQRNGWKLSWHESIEQIAPDAQKFTLVLAHEFFDALPFHILQRTDQGWHEVLIASGPDPAAPTILKPSDSSAGPSLDIRPTGSAPRFRQVLSPTPTLTASLLGLSSPRFEKLPAGSRIEVSPASFKIARQIGGLLHDSADRAHTAGSALIVDYGGDKVFGSSFRGFKNHKLVDVFHRPGECDLTVNVDFAYLREAAKNLASHHGPLPQAAFLERMGLRTRVAALAAAVRNPHRRAQIERAAERLVDPTGMGAQYQVMALTGKPHAAMADAERWPFVEPAGAGGP